MVFARLVALKKSEQKYQDNFFVEALVEHMVVLCKITFEDIRISELVYKNLVANFEPEQIIKEFHRIIGMMIRSILSHENSKGSVQSQELDEVKTLYGTILNKYCIEKNKNARPKLENIQFVFLEEMPQINRETQKCIQKLKKSLYKDEDKIASSLVTLATNIQETSIEDLLYLNLSYLVQILNDSGSEKLLEVLENNSKIRKEVYEKVFSIKDRYFISEYVQSGKALNSNHVDIKDTILKLYGCFLSKIGLSHSLGSVVEPLVPQRSFAKNGDQEERKTFDFDKWDPEA